MFQKVGAFEWTPFGGHGGPFRVTRTHIKLFPSVTIEGNQVAITAEVEREKEDRQGEKLLRSERYYGRVYRAFSLAQTWMR